MNLNNEVIYPQFIINKNPQLIEIAGRVPELYEKKYLCWHQVLIQSNFKFSQQCKKKYFC